MRTPTFGVGAKSSASTRYLPRAEAARKVGCSIRHLERLAGEGAGPPMVRHGRRIVYSEAGLDAWMQAREVRSTSEATVRDAERGR